MLPEIHMVKTSVCVSHDPLFATSWTVAHQAPLSMRFSRQGYWSGLPFPSPGDLPNPGIQPRCPALWADSLPAELQEKPLWFPSWKQSMGYKEVAGKMVGFEKWWHRNWGSHDVRGKWIRCEEKNMGENSRPNHCLLEAFGKQIFPFLTFLNVFIKLG